MKKLGMVLAVGLLLIAVGAFAGTASWTAVTTYTDGSSIPSTKTVTYNLKSSTSSTGPFTSEGTTTATTKATALPSAGTSKYWVVSAIVDGKESADSSPPFPYNAPYKTPANPVGLKIVP